jgi:hypothetical protein
MAVIQGDDPEELARTALDALGGIHRFVSRADIVLVKPNIGWDRTPEQAANTNPRIVAEIVRQCWNAGAKRVIVADVSCNDPRRCFQRSGIAEAARHEGAEVILPDPARFKDVDLQRNVDLILTAKRFSPTHQMCSSTSLTGQPYVQFGRRTEASAPCAPPPTRQLIEPRPLGAVDQLRDPETGFEESTLTVPGILEESLESLRWP